MPANQIKHGKRTILIVLCLLLIIAGLIALSIKGYYIWKNNKTVDELLASANQVITEPLNANERGIDVESATNGSTESETKPENVNSQTTSETKQKNNNKEDTTTLEPKKLKDYDGTVLVYSSEDGHITGTAGISYDNFSKQLDVIFNLYITDTLVREDAATYPYAGKVNNDTVAPGLLSTRYCDADEIGDPMAVYWADAFNCPIHGGDVDKFYVVLQGEFADYESIANISELYLFKSTNDTFDPTIRVQSGTLTNTYMLTSEVTTVTDYAQHPFLN